MNDSVLGCIVRASARVVAARVHPLRDEQKVMRNATSLDRHFRARRPTMATSLAAAAASVAPRATARPARPRAAARGVRGGSRSVVVRGKKGAWAKEFDPDYEKDKEVVEITAEAEGWPGLASASSFRSTHLFDSLARRDATRASPSIGALPPRGVAPPRRRRSRRETPPSPIPSFRPVLSIDRLSLTTRSTLAALALARRASSVVAEDTEVETYNILTKLTGPLNITWNGIGVIQVPKGADKKESGNVCKTVLVQRKEQVLAECDRLYPKMKSKPKDYVIQLFEDPYADPVDLSAVPPAGLEPVPAEIKYMPKGKRYPY